jgi:hypothetical protein
MAQIETDIDRIEAAALLLRDWKWEPHHSSCQIIDNNHGPCSCGAERRDNEILRNARDAMSPDTIIALIKRHKALLAAAKPFADTVRPPGRMDHHTIWAGANLPRWSQLMTLRDAVSNA